MIVVVKTLSKRLLEAGLVMVLVLSTSLLFFDFLETVFPTGTSLKKLVSEADFFYGADTRNEFERGLLVSADGKSTSLVKADNLAAVMVTMRNRVKSKRASGIAWVKAKQGMRLYDRDAVQTFKQSGALIQLDQNNYIDMSENSLVIIKNFEQDPLLRERRSRFLILAGELRGRITGTSRQGMHLEVATAGLVAKVNSRNPGEAAEFKIKVNPDKSSTITVLNGNAKIVSQEQSVQVNTNQTITVHLEEPPPEPVNLPDVVELIAPQDQGVFYYRDFPRKINFNWKSLADVDLYQIQIARDNAFTDLVADEQVRRANFAHGNLKKGTYYWRVKGLTGWSEGAFSATRQIRIVQDLEPPLLDIKLPPDILERKEFVINGATEIGANVFINGEPVKISDEGTFSYTLSLEPGVNVIVVEAVDTPGNVTYKSKLVNVINRVKE